MRISNLSLVVAILALSVGGAATAARFEAARTTAEQAAVGVGPAIGPPEGTGPGTLPRIGATTSPDQSPSATGTPAAPSTAAAWSEPTTTDPAASTSTGPSTAAATRTIDGGTVDTAGLEWDSPSLRDRGTEALAAITYPWRARLPEWEIRFHDGTEGAYGYTLTQESVIDIYVRDDQSTELLAHVIAHELGHAIDVTLNDRDDRARWQETRGIGDAPWWPDSRASDFATGAGDFAEAFAAWQVGTGAYRSELAPPPTEAQLAILAELASG